MSDAEQLQRRSLERLNRMTRPAMSDDLEREPAPLIPGPRPHRVTPPRLRGEPERLDVERLHQQALCISEILQQAGSGPGPT